jgi:hypothetical protein
MAFACDHKLGANSIGEPGGNTETLIYIYFNPLIVNYPEMNKKVTLL